jgi:hypothetical protein
VSDVSNSTSKHATIITLFFINIIFFLHQGLTKSKQKRSLRKNTFWQKKKNNKNIKRLSDKEGDKYMMASLAS